MARHTSMPPRIQKTPHGDVRLTSRWSHDRYYLVASGSLASIEWMFPNCQSQPQPHGDSFRHAFKPAPNPITVERELRRVSAAWQARWDERLAEETDVMDPDAEQSLASPLSGILTIGQLFDHLREARRPTIAISTYSREQYRLQVWRDALGNDLPLRSLTPERIGLGLAQIAKRTSPGTANSAMGVLKTYLTWAFHQGLIGQASHKTVRPLRDHRQGRHHRAWWTEDEIDRALVIAAQDHHQPSATLLVACGCHLGLRVEEIIMLRWQDLDLDSVDPRSGQPKPVCHVTPHDDWQPKDREARDIPICRPLLAILVQHRQASGYLLQAEPHRPGRPRAGTGWIYRYDPKALSKRLMGALTTVGGKAITMYGMRHSFASNLLIRGVSDVKVSRWLGHTDTRMVHRHYGHLLSYDGDIDALGQRGRTGPPDPQTQIQYQAGG